MEVLPVPPPRTRPVQFTGGLMTLHPQSQALQNVVEAVAMIKPLVQVMQGKDIQELGQQTQEMIKSLRGDTTSGQLDLVWKELGSAERGGGSGNDKAPGAGDAGEGYPGVGAADPGDDQVSQRRYHQWTVGLGLERATKPRGPCNRQRHECK